MSGSIRQKRVGRLIQKELSRIFQLKRNTPQEPGFLSILEVQMSPDLSVAKVYIDMATVKNKQTTLDQLEASKRETRRELGARIGKQVRIIPELLFFADETEERAYRIDQLIRNLNIPPAPLEGSSSEA